jgi:CheY-like chemotaxis protein/HPt (histidine-containing phosphotransfer) domain-containing protein
MDGFELAQRIAELPSCRGVPMVMISSSSVRGDAQRSQEVGIAAYVAKPVSRDELHLVLARAMHLKLAMPASPGAPQAPVDEQRALDVLLVEDNAINQKLAIALLERWGHQVTVAENGSVAVDKVSAHSFDVVLMDMMMPVMDGLEATRLIRAMPAANAAVPIIAMTANAMESDRERCLQAGMNDYISKPIKAQELQELLRDLGRRMVHGNASAAVTSTASDAAYAAHMSHDFAFDYAAGLTSMDQEILEIIGQAFLDQWPEDIQKMQAHLKAGAAEPVLHTAHALKGTLAMFGAEPASGLAAHIEMLAAQGDLDSIESLLATLVLEVNRFRSALELTLQV